jgi:hypothetical protein
MANYVFNVSSGRRKEAAVLLRAKMWGIGGTERHRDALAPGDRALIYVAAPAEAFIARAELATAAHEWAPSEADAYPGESSGGVVLSEVEEWNPAVSMDAVARLVDPSGSNPLVQANAASGFRRGVVRLTEGEYEAVLALSRERRGA